jgi:hypothetical protein
VATRLAVDEQECRMGRPARSQTEDPSSEGIDHGEPFRTLARSGSIL